MNPMDQSIAGGAWASRLEGTFPLIMGSDFAGVVEAVGAGVARFAPGDGVFGQLIVPPLGSAGTYAEQVAAPEEANLALVPAGMDATTAAALPTAGGTALDITSRLAQLSGKTVLIVGAAGGVGVTGINFQVGVTPELLTRLAEEIASGRSVLPPIRTVKLAEVPSLLARTDTRPRGKTVILPG